MTLLVNIVLPLSAGLALGIIYFGGLWLTLRRLPAAKQPAFLVLGSYLGRLGLCLAGFILIAVTAGLQGILICTAAFIAARIVMVRRWGRQELTLTRTDESC
ncbi:MAG: ATP synthase subunit I [Actinobacteria bacterium]|nr:ATP synthase subunit I [Actinomycetota bacterium]